MEVSTLFTIEVTGQVRSQAGDFLPICTVLSSSPIEVWMYTRPPSGGIDVVQRGDGLYVSSFIFWSEARIGLRIGEMAGYLIDLLHSSVGCMVFSETVEFRLEMTRRAHPIHVVFADRQADAWYAFGAIRLDDRLEVIGQ
jgi:hypothetical protein